MALAGECSAVTETMEKANWKQMFFKDIKIEFKIVLMLSQKESICEAVEPLFDSILKDWLSADRANSSGLLFFERFACPSLVNSSFEFSSINLLYAAIRFGICGLFGSISALGSLLIKSR